jgi:hypothetical protein
MTTSTSSPGPPEQLDVARCADQHIIAGPSRCGNRKRKARDAAEADHVVTIASYDYKLLKSGEGTSDGGPKIGT